MRIKSFKICFFLFEKKDNLLSGVNLALRKMAAVLSSTSEITDEGEGKIRINTQSTFKSANILFILDQEIEEQTMDGRTCKV